MTIEDIRYRSNSSNSIKKNNLYVYYRPSLGKFIVSTKGNWLVDALENSKFKQIYNDFCSGVVLRKFNNQLSLEEEALYKFYTNTSYYEFNNALINNSTSKDIVALEDFFNRTLDKLPNISGNFYRGIGKTEIDILRNMEVGDKKFIEIFYQQQMIKLFHLILLEIILIKQEKELC